MFKPAWFVLKFGWGLSNNILVMNELLIYTFCEAMLSHYQQSCYLKWKHITWWRHQMETFSVSLAICAGNSPVPGEFPAQRPVTRSFDVFFDLRLNKRLSKQPWGWWFETPAWSLWRHRNNIQWSNLHHQLQSHCRSRLIDDDYTPALGPVSI